MSTLYVGDVHGCSLELEKLVRKAKADRVVLVGDLFTKGPDPGGVWDLIREYDMEAVLGNHDAWVLENWPLRKKLRKWLAGRPLYLREDGRIVVHAGLHPKKGVKGTTREMALNMRRWRTRHWWKDWRGPECVVFGHDARQGLVRRERKGRPIAIGLDSGCVYGGKLSGWLADEDRILQVRARCVYRPVT